MGASFAKAVTKAWPKSRGPCPEPPWVLGWISPERDEVPPDDAGRISTNNKPGPAAKVPAPAPTVCAPTDGSNPEDRS